MAGEASGYLGFHFGDYSDSSAQRSPHRRILESVRVAQKDVLLIGRGQSGFQPILVRGCRVHELVKARASAGTLGAEVKYAGY